MNNEQQSHNVFLFFGVVGAGKGTQVEMLEKFLTEKGKKIIYISPGQEIRDLIEKGVYVGMAMKDVQDKGGLQPNFLVDSLAMNCLTNKYDGSQELIFDGYPRKKGQSETLELMRQYFKWGTPKIIFIDISEDESVKRLLSRGRHDDSEEGIKQRIAEYKNNVLPALEHLQSLGEYEFYTINGEQSVEEVHSDILKALGLK